MIQLTPQQIEAVATSGDNSPTLFDPTSQTTYVLVPKEKYDELMGGSQAEVEEMAAAINWQRAREVLRPSQQWFDSDEPKPF
jgi:hypothetical protein